MQPVQFKQLINRRSQGCLAGSAYSKPYPADRAEFAPLDRLQALGAKSVLAGQRAEQLIGLAKRGLPQMHSHGAFVHTVRAKKTGTGQSVQAEGDSLRYAIIVALGLSKVDEDVQRHILAGDTVADLVGLTMARAEFSADPGAIALAAWSAAEAANFCAVPLFRKLSALLESGLPIATVDCSWMLTAALAAQHLGDTLDTAALAANRLLSGQAASGLFPHMLPSSASGRWRAHVGCFADQVYPIQALARLYSANGDDTAMEAAERCASRICETQGPDGQWHWHYDIRDASVVEGYPVYSVHQHAMGPMALLDLSEAGGADRWQAIIKGLGWLDRHPEITVPLICDENGVIWRKAARRESKKAVRAISAMTTALKPGLHLPWLDTIFPPNRVDYECRPYELGWLLYAWLSGGTVVRLRAGQPDRHA